MRLISIPLDPAQASYVLVAAVCAGILALGTLVVLLTGNRRTRGVRLSVVVFAVGLVFAPVAFYLLGYHAQGVSTVCTRCGTELQLLRSKLGLLPVMVDQPALGIGCPDGSYLRIAHEETECSHHQALVAAQEPPPGCSWMEVRMRGTVGYLTYGWFSDMAKLAHNETVRASIRRFDLLGAEEGGELLRLYDYRRSEQGNPESAFEAWRRDWKATHPDWP